MLKVFAEAIHDGNRVLKLRRSDRQRKRSKKSCQHECKRRKKLRAQCLFAYVRTSDLLNVADLPESEHARRETTRMKILRRRKVDLVVGGVAGCRHCRS